MLEELAWGHRVLFSACRHDEDDENLETLLAFYIHHFLKYAIQKDTFNIHLIQLESKMTSNGK